MNKESLKKIALELEQLLGHYSIIEPEASALYKALRDILEGAKSMEINQPMEWRDIPGSRFFDEGTLRKYPDLEKSFADFRIKITGEEPPALRRLRSRGRNTGSDQDNPSSK